MRSLHLCVFANSKAQTIFLESSSLDPSERNCFIYSSEIVPIDPRIFVGTCKRTLLRSRLSGCHATLRRRLGEKQSCSYISPISFQLTNAMKMRLKGVAVAKKKTKQTNKPNKCFLFSIMCFSPYTKPRLSGLVYHSNFQASCVPILMANVPTRGCFTGCNRSQTPGWHAFKCRVLNWIKTTFQPFLDIYSMNTVAHMKYIHPVKGNPTSDQTVIS